MSITTRNVIEGWLNEGKQQQARYMLVVCDTFDNEDYPVFVHSPSDLSQVARSYNGVRMQKIMECYDLNLDWESQLSEIRAWHGWNPNK